MGLQGDFFPNQTFPAQQDCTAPVASQEAFVISQTPAKPLPQMITGDAGNDGEIHFICTDNGRVHRRLDNSQRAWSQILQPSDLTQFYRFLV